VTLGRQLADLVQEQQFLAGTLRVADMAGIGARERSLLVPEKLALHKIGRQRRAVHKRNMKSARTLFLRSKAGQPAGGVGAVPLLDAQCRHFLRGDTVPVFARLSSSVARAMSR
jgi:hypothetical protein